MHSLKNTIVAVGLLGLSFAFYQLSSPTAAPDEQLLAPLESVASGPDSGAQVPMAMDGALSKPSDGPRYESATASPPADAKKKAPDVQLPQLEPSKPPVTLKAPSLDSDPSERFARVGDDFEIPGKSPEKEFTSDPSARAPSPLEFADENEKLEAKSTDQSPSGLDRNSFEASPVATTSSVPEPSNDPEQRDQSLMNLLEKQEASSASSPDQKQFAADAHFGGEPNRRKTSDEPIGPSASDTSDFVPGVARNDGINRGDEISATNDPSGASIQQVAANSEATAPAGSKATSTVMIPSPAEYSSIAFVDAWPIVEAMVQEGQLRESLQLLSQYYGRPDLNGPQRQALTAWLDALAGKVIFSAEHYLSAPHVVKDGETFQSLGQRWKVPGQLLFNVNRTRIPTPDALKPGVSLKAVPGPFDAEIDLEKKTMTLFLGKLYAGRFAVRVGISGDPRPGQFRVTMKSRVGNEWKDASGKSYPPGDPNNHYGEYFLGLEQFLCIHQIDDAKEDGHWGCIGLSKQDAADVFAILTQGSVVTIK